MTDATLADESRPPLPRRVVGWLLTPLRLFQQKTSVQLVASHVAAVVLTVLLFFAAITTAFFWSPANRALNLESLTLDYVLGETSRSYAFWLGPDELAETIANPRDVDAQSALTRDLQSIVGGDAPGFDPPMTVSSAPRVASVVIIDLNGMVIASSDSREISTGDTVADLRLDGSRSVVDRTLALGGQPDPTWGSLYSLTVTDERTSATYPLITSEGEMVGVLLLEGNPITQVIGQSRLDVFRTIAEEFFRQMWIFVIPAVLVSIPFGVWRARSISRRLARLANAADALAEGHLNTRLHVKRRDEIGRLAERFNEMGEQIESNDRIRRAFISNVSHELRTPVSIIQGTVERQLERSGPLSTEDAASYAVIQKESGMLTRLIGDLFTLTRMEEHNLRLERRPLDVSAVTEESIRSIRDLAWKQSKVSVESLVPRDLSAVQADETRVRQIINNLLYNALRHTPEGGLIVLQAREAGPMVQLSVSDTGRGIAPEALPSVFDRYFQGERGHRHAEGSGLGLSIVKQLVELHGGTITVDSVVGQGTTFRFTLPRATG